MSPRLRVVAEPGDAALAGLDGSFAWGEARVAGEGDADLVVALGQVQDAAAGVRWLRVAEPDGDSGARVIAPAGEGMWRRAPWPVRDELFELPPGEGAVVAGGDDAERAEIAAAIRAHDIRVSEVRRLDAGSLRDCAAVVLHPEHGALPAEMPAVLAARRVLVTRPCETSFGLQPGVDHLLALSPSEASAYAIAAIKRPRAFDAMRAFGALTAERHRASVLYGRLIADLSVA